jgi:hypothetical protein
MSLHITVPSKLLSADGAGERLLPTVLPEMVEKVDVLIEPVATDFAKVWLLEKGGEIFHFLYSSYALLISFKFLVS